MNKTQKTILFVTAILLSAIAFVFFGKVFKFERGKDKSDIVIDDKLITKLYSYLPSSNDYELDTIYIGYSSYNSLNISTIENMIVSYLNQYEKDRVENINGNDLIIAGLDSSVVTPLYKISKSNLEYGLSMVFGNRQVTFKDAALSFNIKARYRDNYLYIYQEPSDFVKSHVEYRLINKYSISDDKTIKIYDYYLKCDITDNNCYNDEKKRELNNYIKYSSGLNINDYKDKLVQYEHVFKINNGNYYWVSSTKI